MIPFYVVALPAIALLFIGYLLLKLAWSMVQFVCNPGVLTMLAIVWVCYLIWGHP
jgi:hypothetical protein